MTIPFERLISRSNVLFLLKKPNWRNVKKKRKYRSNVKQQKCQRKTSRLWQKLDHQKLVQNISSFVFLQKHGERQQTNTRTHINTKATIRSSLGRKASTFEYRLKSTVLPGAQFTEDKGQIRMSGTVFKLILIRCDLATGTASGQKKKTHSPPLCPHAVQGV